MIYESRQTLLSALVFQGKGGIVNGIAGGGRYYSQKFGKGGRGFHCWKIDREFFEIFKNFVELNPRAAGRRRLFTT